MNELNEPSPPVQVPADALSEEVLQAVLENFVMREGTDYGAKEITHEAKIERLRRQVSRGDIVLVFDPNTESVTLMTKNDWAKARK